MKKIIKYIPADSAFRQSKSFYLIPFLILVLTFLAYMPSLKNEFTNWDDPFYVINNSIIKDFSSGNIKRIFSEFCMGNYHPLTMLSLSLDYSFGKLDPESYHRTNLILHLANTFLVFIFAYLLFEKMEVAAIVSALFGAHTIHVESVAWISERKDVLYTFFFLFSLILYLRYIKKDNAKYYWLSLVLFLLSILSKGMAVSFAISLFAIDFFLGRKLTDKKVILEKIPFLILSLVFGIVAIIAQKLDPNAEGISDYNFFLRLIFACYGFVNYFVKLILPIDLSAFYPYPDQYHLSFIFWLCPFIALGITGLIFYSFRKRKDIFFGFVFFIINIFLVLQLLPVGRAIMADRYAYISSIGFFIIIAGTYQWLIEKNPALRKILIGFLSAYTILLSVLTYQHSKIWKDSFSLWEHAIKNYPSDAAYYNLGEAYHNLEKYPEAIENYSRAIALNPVYVKAYNNRGVAQIPFKKYEASMLDFNKAISIDPACAGAYFNRGNVWSNINQPEKALAEFSKAILIDTNYADAYYHRANTWIDLSRPDKALADYDKAVSFGLPHLELLNKRGLAKKILKDYSGAMRDFSQVILLDPAYAEAYYNRGNIWIDLKDPGKALADFNKALSFVPFDAKTLNNRGLIKMMLKDYQGAMEDFNKSISIDPFYVRAYANRAQLKYNLKDFSGSDQDEEKVRSLKSGSY
jgi:protein O-mannosyl-transferase